MITEEQLTKAREEFVHLMSSNTKEYGNTAPVFALIIKDPELKKPGIMLFPLPSDLMGNKSFKEILVGQVLPRISEDIVQKNKYEVHTTCFCFEARMWVGYKKVDDNESDVEEVESIDIARKMMKNDPDFKDIMLIQFEDKYDREIKFFEIQKSTSVDPEGEIITKTDLEELKDFSFNSSEDDVKVQGVFVDTFKIFFKP